MIDPQRIIYICLFDLESLVDVWVY